MDSARLQSFKDKLLGHEKCLAPSKLYAHTVALLKPLNFRRIRCLALGSPTQEFQALFQLAYLKLLRAEFSIAPDRISVYDPAFSPEDVYLLGSELEYVVEAPETFSPDLNATRETLFYMPHAPRSLTEEILAEHKPCMFLANDFSVTMGTLTKAKFLLKYPILATLVHLLETKFSEKGETLDKTREKKLTEDDGFVIVVLKRRRNRPKKNVYVEPQLVYDNRDHYFSGGEITRIMDDVDAVWKDSFSDLALNLITLKKE